MTPEEWFAKASYEGGLIEGFNYGLKPSTITWNSEDEESILPALTEVYESWKSLRAALDDLWDLLPEDVSEGL